MPSLVSDLTSSAMTLSRAVSMAASTSSMDAVLLTMSTRSYPSQPSLNRSLDLAFLTAVRFRGDPAAGLPGPADGDHGLRARRTAAQDLDQSRRGLRRARRLQDQHPRCTWILRLHGPGAQWPPGG